MKNAMSTEGDQERYFVEIEKLYSKIKSLREQLELLHTTATEYTESNNEIKRIIEILEKENFSFTEYDDLIVRRIVECIRVMSNRTIIIILKDGFEITETLE